MLHFLSDCGSQCIIKNAKKTKKGPLDKVLNFVERQQSIQRQDAQEKEREKTEESKRKRELKEIRRKERKVWWNKHWKIVLVISIGIIILLYILQYLGL